MGSKVNVIDIWEELSKNNGLLPKTLSSSFDKFDPRLQKIIVDCDPKNIQATWLLLVNYFIPEKGDEGIYNILRSIVTMNEYIIQTFAAMDGQDKDRLRMLENAGQYMIANLIGLLSAAKKHLCKKSQEESKTQH